MVGLVSDFFLQMFFFTTVLSIDIRRMEVSAVLPSRPSHQHTSNHLAAVGLSPLPSAG